MKIIHRIVGFKTDFFDAHLSGNGQRKVYIVYNRRWHMNGDEYTAERICGINYDGSINWYMYIQEDYVASKVKEMDHLIDVCVRELNYE